MTTSALTNTLSITDLTNETGQPLNMAAMKVTGQHDGHKMADGTDRKFGDFNMLADMSTGLGYSFPSVYKVRETVEWESSVVEHRAGIREKGIATASPEGHYAALTMNMLIIDTAVLIGASDASFDTKMSSHLPLGLCSIWAMADALCLELTGKLWEQGDEALSFFRQCGSDIYGVGGRNLASQMWDLVEAAHHQGVANRLDERTAKKQQSDASKKKAKAKAAKKARKR